MAALRRLRASGGDRRPVRSGLQHSRRSCVLHSHIGARDILGLPVVHGAIRPAEGRRHGARRNRPVRFRATGGELWLPRSGERHFCGGYSGDRPLCFEIEVQDQSDMTPTVKTGITPANLDDGLGELSSAWVRLVLRPPSPHVRFGHGKRTYADHLAVRFPSPTTPDHPADFGPTGVIATLTNRRFWTRPSSIDKALHSPSAPHTNFRLPIGKAPAKASLRMGSRSMSPLG